MISRGYFGKLPNFPDFIKYNAAGEELLVFDKWIQEGIVNSKSILKNEWESYYRNYLYFNFLFNSPEAKNILLGSIFPGHDKSGRIYPFLIIFKIERNYIPDNRLFIFPLLLKQISEQMISIINEFFKSDSLSTLNNQINSLPLDVENSDIPSKFYKEYLNDTTISSFFKGMQNGFDSSQKFFIINNLYSISLLQNRKNFNPVNSYTIKFPLSAEGSLSIFETSFWIDLFLHINKNIENLQGYSVLKNALTSKVSALFWPCLPAERAGKSNSSFIIVGKLSPKNFLELIDPDFTGDNLIDLNNQDKELTSLPRNIAALLNENHLNLSEFLIKI